MERRTPARRAVAMNPDCSSGMGGHTYEVDGTEWVCTECGHAYVPEGGSMRGVWHVRPGGDASREARG